MELGEIDLNQLLQRERRETADAAAGELSGAQPLHPNLLRLVWQQMLTAVQTIHEEVCFVLASLITVITVCTANCAWRLEARKLRLRERQPQADRLRNRQGDICRHNKHCPRFPGKHAMSVGGTTC